MHAAHLNLFSYVTITVQQTRFYTFSNPYGRPQNRREERNRKGGRGGGGGGNEDRGGNRYGGRGGGGGSGADGSRKNWFKMTVSTLDINST